MAVDASGSPLPLIIKLDEKWEHCDLDLRASVCFLVSAFDRCFFLGAILSGTSATPFCLLYYGRTCASTCTHRYTGGRRRSIACVAGLRWQCLGTPRLLEAAAA